MKFGDFLQVQCFSVAWCRLGLLFAVRLSSFDCNVSLFLCCLWHYNNEWNFYNNDATRLNILSIVHIRAMAPTPWGTGSTCPPPFYKWLGTGGTVSRRTTNKKLTKLYWPSQKRSPNRLIVLLEPKSGGARPKKFCFRRISVLTFASDRCPHFQIRSGATAFVRVHTLGKSVV